MDPAKKFEAPPRDEVMDWQYIEWLHALTALEHMAGRPDVNPDHSTVEVIGDGMLMLMPRSRFGQTGRAPILYFDHGAYSTLETLSLTKLGLWSAWCFLPDRVQTLRVQGWQSLFTKNPDVPACSLVLPSGSSLSTFFGEFNAMEARPVKRNWPK